MNIMILTIEYLVDLMKALISTGGSTIKFEGMSMSTYPYIGHLDHPIYPTYDLNFSEMTKIYDGGALDGIDI